MLNVIEDAAQHRVFYNGKHTGTLSQIGILSMEIKLLLQGKEGFA